MPEVRVFVRAAPWDHLLKECRGDTKAARRKIAAMVNEKYGA